MMAHLRQECVKRFPDSYYKSIAGFIFLRFFCPAILSPDSNGITTGTCCDFHHSPRSPRMTLCSAGVWASATHMTCA
jgi:hypothetical protein